MADKLILLAGGGHGSVVLDALLSCGNIVAGILDPARSIASAVFGIPVLGGDEWLQNVSSSDHVLANGAGCSPGSYIRSHLFTTWKERGFRFATVIHRTAILGREVQLGEGAQVMAGAILQCRVLVGTNSVVNTGASLDHDAQISPHVFIGPRAVLCGDVRISEHAFVGAGATILPGVTIGPGAIVGAGAVVTHDVPEKVIVVGNPAAQKNLHR